MSCYQGRVPVLVQYGGQVPLNPLPPAPSFIPSTTLISSEFPSVTSDSYNTALTASNPFRDAPTPAVDIQHWPEPFLESPIERISNQALVSTTLSVDVPTSTSIAEMFTGKRVPAYCLSVLVSLFTSSQASNHISNNSTSPSEKVEEKSWIETSHSWFNRKTCEWLGICGAEHLRNSEWINSKPSIGWAHEQVILEDNHEKIDASAFWTSGESNPKDWSEEEQALREIPQYVYDYAPYVHLYSGEKFWPCDIAEHIIHTTPHLNYTPIRAPWDHPSLTNLADLNDYGRFVYLKSDDNVEERPDWLGGKQNIPSSPNGGDDDDDDPEGSHSKTWADWHGMIGGGTPDENTNEWVEAREGNAVDRGSPRSHPSASEAPIPTHINEGEEHIPQYTFGKRVVGGRSDAPAVLVVVPKGKGVVDAFWFYFYSYNLGNVVFNVRFGNHVGDWEHSAIRFHNGKPKAVWFSEHNFGEAFSYNAVEKIGKRPVVYSATGTHAMYARPGVHPYVLPWGLLHDVTDKGPLWDPSLNTHAYTYDVLNDTLRASNFTPKAPTNWFFFDGHWGDKVYPLSDPRQYQFAGQYHYVTGPLGPRFKDLGRVDICPSGRECKVRNWFPLVEEVRTWAGAGDGEEMTREFKLES
ncbi:hypothetical protein M501DRAFT_1061398 [Patellaria atrata CBS 101060]|uniref:Vacuolar protein sorting-associated protein 62 n=1 Tax=Patellaria atrata CBS 101060 TaxID=1346257 RepID=A0A9P4S458_9PEZI|nr:hypothetical protein M501DRAFT_1061398 [Patellaria atrata CBS 101060]